MFKNCIKKIDMLFKMRYASCMTDIERDAIDANYPTYSDIVKLAAFEAPWPLQSDLADFIENLCKIMGWPVTDTFQRIHDMIQERVKPLDNDR